MSCSTCGATETYRAGRCHPCWCAVERARARKRRGTPEYAILIGDRGQCRRCNAVPPSPKSRLGYCDVCKKADFNEKAAAKKKAAYVPQRSPANVCACGCGQLCRPGVQYKYASEECKKKATRKRPVKPPKPVTKPKPNPPKPVVKERPNSPSRQEVFAPGAPVVVPAGVKVTRIACGLGRFDGRETLWEPIRPSEDWDEKKAAFVERIKRKGKL